MVFCLQATARTGLQFFLVRGLGLLPALAAAGVAPRWAARGLLPAAILTWPMLSLALSATAEAMDSFVSSAIAAGFGANDEQVGRQRGRCCCKALCDQHLMGRLRANQE